MQKKFGNIVPVYIVKFYYHFCVHLFPHHVKRQRGYQWGHQLWSVPENIINCGLCPRISSTVVCAREYHQLWSVSENITNCGLCPRVSSTVVCVREYHQLWSVPESIINCGLCPRISSTVVCAREYHQNDR